MTFQYRIRSKYEDDRWRLRIRFCQALILNAVDGWCRTDVPFPVRKLVACCLHLFSKRCDLSTLSESRTCQQLVSIARDATAEYFTEWPHRSRDDAALLIDAMERILLEAKHHWRDNGLTSLSAETVVAMLVNEIVNQQFVVFHHKESTARDINHWGI